MANTKQCGTLPRTCKSPCSYAVPSAERFDANRPRSRRGLRCERRESFENADGGHGATGFESGDSELGHARSLGELGWDMPSWSRRGARPGRARRRAWPLIANTHSFAVQAAAPFPAHMLTHHGPQSCRSHDRIRSPATAVSPKQPRQPATIVASLDPNICSMRFTIRCGVYSALVK
jgi:hypothetical protein